MENKLLTYTHSPHVKAPRSTRKIMLNVCIALIPSAVMAIVYFGLNAFLLIALSLLSATLSEGVYLLIAKKSVKEIIKGFDCSSLVTGLLVALSLGSQTPLYVPVFASAFAIIVVKMLFGGTGKNLVNPAITGRIFAFMSFTAVIASGWLAPSISTIMAITPSGSQNSVTTGATVLGNLLNNGASEISNLDLFLGTGVTGCMGETCKLALIVGGIYLAVMGIINIGFPVIMIGVAGLTSVMLNGFDFSLFLPSILSGGLIMGAIFMATDYTTTPNTTLGNIIYFIMLGLLTAVLRYFAKIEVVSFVILLMNLTVPLIDKFIISVPFGKVKTKKVKGGN